MNPICQPCRREMVSDQPVARIAVGTRRAVGSSYRCPGCGCVVMVSIHEDELNPPLAIIGQGDYATEVR